jgi:hypothetical protein
LIYLLNSCSHCFRIYDICIFTYLNAVYGIYIY